VPCCHCIIADGHCGSVARKLSVYIIRLLIALLLTIRDCSVVRGFVMAVVRKGVRDSSERWLVHDVFHRIVETLGNINGESMHI